MLEGLHCATCCREFQMTNPKKKKKKKKNKQTAFTLAVLLSNGRLYSRQENTEYFCVGRLLSENIYKSWSFLLKLLSKSKGPRRDITLVKLEGLLPRAPKLHLHRQSGHSLPSCHRVTNTVIVLIRQLLAPKTWEAGSMCFLFPFPITPGRCRCKLWNEQKSFVRGSNTQ